MHAPPPPSPDARVVSGRATAAVAPATTGGRRSLAALTAALAVAFVAVAADAHAQAGCSDVVATWSSGAQEVVGTTCDDPSGGRADESAPAPDPAARDV